MGAGSFDFIKTDTTNRAIEQGATFQRTLTWTIDGVAVDLSAYTARMQVRLSKEATDVLLDLRSSGEDPEIVLGADGTIVITVSAVVTAALDFENGVYDLELTSPDGVVTRLLEGMVEISKEVTRG